MIIKKAVILLYPPYLHTNEEIIESLAACCKANNLAVIDIIIADNYNNSALLQSLIQNISKFDEPAILVTNRSLLSSADHIIMWAILGTLLSSRILGEVWLYRRNWQVGAGSNPSNLYTLKKVRLIS